MIVSRRTHHLCAALTSLGAALVVVIAPSRAGAATAPHLSGSGAMTCRVGLAPQEPIIDCVVRPRPGPRVAFMAGPDAQDAGPGARSQDASPARDELGERIKELYDIVVLRDAIGLEPKRPVPGVKIIEVSRGTIAIDGEVITGRELRERIGSDADLIVQLTYLDERLRRELLGIAETARPSADPDAASSTSDDAAAQGGSGANSRDAEQNQRDTTGRSRRGDTFRMGENYTVGRNDTVDGDLVVIGGSARVEGEVTGEVVVVGGSLYVGPDAIVRRDVSIIGGALDRQPGARIDGKVNDIGFGRVQWRGVEPIIAGPWNVMARVAGVFMTLVRIGLLVLLGCIIMAISPRLVERIGERASEEPVKAGAVGLLVQILFVPVLVITILLLVISIIGIPLLAVVPLGLVAAIIALLIGFTGVAERIGRWTAARFGWETSGPYMSLAVGVLVLMGLTLLYKVMAMAGGVLGMMGLVLAILGIAIEYVAWTVGLGATILLRFARRQPSAGATLEVPPPAVA